MKIIAKIITKLSKKEEFQQIQFKDYFKDQEEEEEKKKLNVLINSPFYSPDKNGKKAKLFNYNENYKDYNNYENSYPIRVLDSDYQPLRPYNFRSVEKNKWVSPTNFHI